MFITFTGFLNTCRIKIKLYGMAYNSILNMLSGISVLTAAMPDYLQFSGENLEFSEQTVLYASSSCLLGLDFLPQLINLPAKLVRVEYHFILRAKPGHTTVVTICLSVFFTRL